MEEQNQNENVPENDQKNPNSKRKSALDAERGFFKLCTAFLIDERPAGAASVSLNDKIKNTRFDETNSTDKPNTQNNKTELKPTANQSKPNRKAEKRKAAAAESNQRIRFLIDSPLSHYEWAMELGFTEPEFENAVRGYYLNGQVLFYKNDLSYDNKCIEAAKLYAPLIKHFCGIKNLEIWCGAKRGKIGEPWKPVHLLGKI